MFGCNSAETFARDRGVSSVRYRTELSQEKLENRSATNMSREWGGEISHEVGCAELRGWLDDT